jgi:hypothetical protein
MEDKIKELEKENLQLKKDKAKLSSRIHSLSMQVVQAKKAKKRHISKIRATIQRTKKIQPNQFRCAAKSLFKEGKKEYTAEFIKLATKLATWDILPFKLR